MFTNNDVAGYWQKYQWRLKHGADSTKLGDADQLPWSLDCRGFLATREKKKEELSAD